MLCSFCATGSCTERIDIIFSQNQVRLGFFVQCVMVSDKLIPYFISPGLWAISPVGTYTKSVYCTLSGRLSSLPLRVSPLVRSLSSEAAPSPEADPLPPPPPKGTYPEKIQALVRDISQLTLLETSQLNELLKVSAGQAWA